jgi:O-acetylserine/cysteine efflux transporter
VLTIAPRDLAFLVLINLIWGYNLIASKIGVGHFPPVWFTAMRFTLVALCLFPFLRLVRGQMNALVVACLFSGVLHFALLFCGLNMADTVSTVAIASQLGVPFSTLMSIVFLDEVVHWRRWLGILLSFAGVMVMSLAPGVFDFWQGLALVILSAFAGSLGLMAVKKLSGIRPLEIQAWMAILSAPTLAVLSLGFESGQFAAMTTAGWKVWAALAFTAMVASLIAHTGYYYLIQRYPVTSVAPLTVLSPIFGVFFCVTLLGDELTWRIALGGMMTLSGIFIVALRERKIIETGT